MTIQEGESGRDANFRENVRPTGTAAFVGPKHGEFHCLNFQLCVTAILFAFFPILNLSLVIDDIDIVSILKATESGSMWGQLNAILQRCMLPHYFRPLCSPIFLLFYDTFGPNPIPLHLAMLLLHIATAWCIYSIARELSEAESVARVAFCVYAFSWIHWTTLSTITNFGQVAAHFLFWAALRIYIKSPTHVPKLRDFGRILALITLALFFKEDVIIFPAFALAAGFYKKDDKRRRWTMASLFSIWAAIYLVCRHFILPASFLRPDNYYTFAWHGLTIWKSWLQVLELLIEGLLPVAAAQYAWQRSLQSASLFIGVWAIFAILVGVCLGHSLWSVVTHGPVANNKNTVARCVFLGIVGFIAGLVPYALFKEALVSWDAHRFALSCGAFSIGFGGVFHGLISSLQHAKKPFARASGIGITVSFILTALAIRYPDSRCGPFARVRLIRETQQTVSHIQDVLAGSLQDGDELTFAGFDPLLRIPQLIQVLEPKSIAVTTWIGETPLADRAGWFIQRSVSGQISVIAQNSARRKLATFRQAETFNGGSNSISTQAIQR